ncbi:MAG: histidine kinase [Bacteroidota bacterium]
MNIFNAIFSTITLIYILLYISHQFLYRRNSEKLTREMLIKEGIEEDFRQFKRGINTDLLFESLESLIVLMRQHKDKADDLLHALSIVYRYILSDKKMELVPFAEECRVVDQLVSLFNHLPYRQIDIQSTNGIQAWVVPGALLAIVESIIRSSIASAHAPLLLQVEETKEYILIHYEPHERLEADGAWDKLEAVRDSYAVYTDQLLKVTSEAGRQQIFIPKLILDH